MTEVQTQKFKPIEEPVTNFLTGRQYRFVSASLLSPSDDLLSQITTICQESAIYKYLFEQKLDRRPYSIEDAARFFKWATDGWSKQSHFVFLILSTDGDVAGAIDIKSASRPSAEIGYWCSSHHRGLMTNALKKLASIAFNVGYLSLYARVRLDNSSSIGVLDRAGFQSDPNWNHDPLRARYVLELTR